MFSQKIIIFISLIILFVDYGSAQKKNQQKVIAKTNKDQAKIQAKLNAFYKKYCAENNDDTLKKLEKCEEIQPQYLKDIEMECVKKVLKKSSDCTYKEIRMVECDKELGDQFDDCEGAKLNQTKSLDDPQLMKIATKIMNCGFDCYGIK